MCQLLVDVFTPQVWCQTPILSCEPLKQPEPTPIMVISYEGGGGRVGGGGGFCLVCMPRFHGNSTNMGPGQTLADISARSGNASSQ